MPLVQVNKLLRHATAVSYTHLDVYKRQEEVPATYDEMLELKDKLGEGQYLMSTEDVNTWSIAPLFYSLGGTYTNEDFTQASGYLNGEESVKALERCV